MDNTFVNQLFLSFLIGGTFVTACTMVAQRFGSTLGGIIGGFPSTIVVALYFIGLVESPAAASNATSIIPLIVGYNGLFLITYAHLADKSFLTGISAALGVWFFLTITTLKLGMNSFALSLILYGFIFLFLVLRLRRKIIVDALPNKIIRFTAAQIGMRFIFSGSIIAIAIYLSKKSGPIIGGVMSVFPIVFISTIIIAYLSAGKKFSISLTNSMMVSSMVNLVAYAVCVRFFYLWWGIALGTYISILVSMGTAFAVHFALRRLLKKIKAIQPAAGSTG